VGKSEDSQAGVRPGVFPLSALEMKWEIHVGHCSGGRPRFVKLDYGTLTAAGWAVRSGAFRIGHPAKFESRTK